MIKLKKRRKLILPLEYETDNRDSNETWLQVYTKEGEYLGYISLTVKDMFELIGNVYENDVDMDKSKIENGIEELKMLIHKK